MSQSLRIDSYPGSCHGDEDVLHGYCSAIQLGSLNTPDTMMIYLHGNTTPLGLIPGTVAVFYHHTIKRSKSGNVYLVDAVGSSYQVLSLDHDAVTGDRVPCVRVADLMDGLVGGQSLCEYGSLLRV